MREILKNEINSNPWFARYYDLKELDLIGLRDNLERQEIYSECNFTDQSILDVGCNLGKNFIFLDTLKPKILVGIDLTTTIEISKKVALFLKLKNTKLYSGDLNKKDWYESLKKKSGIPQYDYSIFVSVYGTRELKNRYGILIDLIKNTKKIIFFEGHHLENHFKYSKLLLKTGCNNFEFKGYLRDKKENKSSGIRPFFTIQNSGVNWNSIIRKINETIGNNGRVIIGIEGLAGAGKTTHIKKLKDTVPKGMKVLVIDDLRDEQGNIYHVSRFIHHRIIITLKNKFLKRNYLSLTEAIRDKHHDVVIVSDYKLRKYLDHTDILLKVKTHKRGERLSKRGEDLKDFNNKEIFSPFFVTNNFYTLENNE